jgi:hypothetical protein
MHIESYLKGKAEGCCSLVKEKDGDVYKVTNQFDQLTGVKLDDLKEEVSLAGLEASEAAYTAALADLETVIAEVKAL